jgi:hypothetical protein
MFWALVLLAAGTVVALAAVRRGWAQTVRGTGLSLGRRRPPKPEALPVPVRSARVARGRSRDTAGSAPLQAEPVTETDELDDFPAR